MDVGSERMISRKDGAVGWIVFNNPARHNAVSLDMWRALGRIVDSFASDPTVRVVVVRGAGERAFVSGADISEFDEKRATPAQIETYDTASEESCRKLELLAKPTIAMIRGYCIGGGTRSGAAVRPAHRLHRCNVWSSCGPARVGLSLRGREAAGRRCRARSHQGDLLSGAALHGRRGDPDAAREQSGPPRHAPGRRSLTLRDDCRQCSSDRRRRQAMRRRSPERPNGTGSRDLRCAGGRLFQERGLYRGTYCVRGEATPHLPRHLAREAPPLQKQHP